MRNAVEDLEAKRAQLRARIDAIQARDRERQRKEDTRRKVLAGAVALALAKENEGFGRWFYSALDHRLKRADERRLFGLLTV